MVMALVNLDTLQTKHKVLALRGIEVLGQK
jgi:hypothetical protein